MTTCKYCTLKKAADLLGYSPKAIEGKIYRGDWIEGKHYRHAPDRRLMINLDEVEKWIEGEPAVT